MMRVNAVRRSMRSVLAARRSIGYPGTYPNPDPEETQEWLESLDALLERKGPHRSALLLQEVMMRASAQGVPDVRPASTPYCNTLPASVEGPYPGDMLLESNLRNMMRWNAAVMVALANSGDLGVGGHIATYASACDLYEVGFQHFFKGKDAPGRGDAIFIQGHASPGVYARAFLEGRLSKEDLLLFRQEAKGVGLSSYPHPRLMPEFWEYPSVSMGLGPMNAVYLARYYRYLRRRNLADTKPSRVWAFLGDGEMDEAESIASIAIAGREKLNNLVFVVNCNFQRLDGPVRGNAKVVQELEGLFAGAGWHVIKLLWGSPFESIVRSDQQGAFLERLQKTPDGDCQRLASQQDGAVIRAELFADQPDLVAHLSDQELLDAFVNCGGHSPAKIHAAYAAACATTENGGPVVILAKTIKGKGIFNLQGVMSSHQKKTMTHETLCRFRDDLGCIPLSDEQIKTDPFYHPGADSPEVKYMLERRGAMGGFLPERRAPDVTTPIPESAFYDSFLASLARKPQRASTTMAFGGLLKGMMEQKEFGPRVVPIVPDEARTFGLDVLFPKFKIHSPFGQKYTPVDAQQMLNYGESEDGQILQEGINESGSLCSFIAAGTSYSTQACPTMPFYIFYSMFGFQRVMDLIWQAADARARGFLLGATCGRTTLNGEGLQHADGHSSVMAGLIPSVRAYDPAFAFELTYIIERGVEEMWREQKDVIYYLMLYNENYLQPTMPEGAKAGVLKGAYKYLEAAEGKAHTVRLLGSGCIMQQALDAKAMLEAEYDVGCEVWSVTSYTELQRDAQECQRHNRVHPELEPRVPYAKSCFGDGSVTVAVTDHVSSLAAQITNCVGGTYLPLGTEGFGRSDSRDALRRFFEIDAPNVVLAALSGLAQEGKIPATDVVAAREKMNLTLERADIAAL